MYSDNNSTTGFVLRVRIFVPEDKKNSNLTAVRGGGAEGQLSCPLSLVRREETSIVIQSLTERMEGAHMEWKTPIKSYFVACSRSFSTNCTCLEFLVI